MALSLEQRMRKFMVPSMAPKPSSPEPDAPVETDEHIDLSKVIKRRSGSPLYQPPTNLISLKKVKEQKEEMLRLEDIAEAEIPSGESGLQEQLIRFRKQLQTAEQKLNEAVLESAQQADSLIKQTAQVEAQAREIAILNEQKDYYVEENRRKDEDLIGIKRSLKSKENEIEQRKAGTQRLESDLALLKDTVYKQREQEKFHEQELEDLRAFKSEQETLLQKHKEDVLSLENMLSQKESEILGGRHEIGILKSERDDLGARLARLQTIESDLAAERKNLGQREETVSELRRINAERDEELDNVREQLQTVRNDFNAVQETAARLKHIEAELESERQGNARQREEIASLRADISRKATEAERYEEEIRAANSELEGLKYTLSQLQDVESELIAEREIRNQKEEANSILEKTVSEREDQISNVRGELQTVQTDLNTAREEVSRLRQSEAELEEFRLKLSGLQTVETDLAQERLNLDSVRSQLAEAEARLREQAESSSQKHLEELQQEIGETKIRIQELEQQNSSLKAEVDSLKPALGEKNKLIQEQIRAALSLKEQVESLESQQHEMEKTEDNLNCRVVEYEKLVPVLQDNLDTSQSLLEILRLQRVRLQKALTYAATALIIVVFALLYVHFSKEQMVREMDKMSLTLQQNERVIESKIEKIEVLGERITENEQFIKEQASRIGSLNSSIRRQRGQILSMRNALAAKKSEVIRMKAELEETKQEFFEYRQGIFSDQAALHGGQIKALDYEIERLEFILDNQLSAIDRQTEILKRYTLL